MRPASLDELLELKMKHPKAKLVIGNTEIGEYLRSPICSVEMFFMILHYRKNSCIKAALFC